MIICVFLGLAALVVLFLGWRAFFAKCDECGHRGGVVRMVKINPAENDGTGPSSAYVGVLNRSHCRRCRGFKERYPSWVIFIKDWMLMIPAFAIIIVGVLIFKVYDEIKGCRCFD